MSMDPQAEQPGGPAPPLVPPDGYTRGSSLYRLTTSRPIAVLMVFVAIMVFGAFSLRLLPLALMPELSYPKLTVRTEYPGAAPAEVEDNVARPLEELLGVVTGVTRIESISRAGSGDVVLEFAWDTDMDEASQDVLEKLDIVTSRLPDGVEQPLILRYDPSLDPVVTLSLFGETDSFDGVSGLKLMRRLADREVRRVLEPVEGVAAVKIKGGLEEEIQVELDEGQLRRTQLSVQNIVDRLSAENVNLAGGTMRDGRTRYLVRTVNEFVDLQDIGEIVLVRREERDVRLRDVATITSGYRDRDVLTRIDGHEAVVIEIYKEADANIIDMAARVRDRVETRVAPSLSSDYGATLEVAVDRSRFIESSIAEVRDTAIIGGGLAVLVLFLFLRDFRSPLIIGLAIPASVLIAFAPLHSLGVSLNVMSLGGLALGVGMLVDNAIVVIESIHRCRQDGDDLVAATIRGTSEVGGAVIASTLTTVAVFFPMVFVEGIAGQMFGDLGLAVVFSLLASLLVALFLIPMLASRGRLSDRTPEQGDPGSIRPGLVATLTRWNSLAELRKSAIAIRRHPWRAVAVPYVLLRFALHLLLELVGKLLVLIVAVLVGPGVPLVVVGAKGLAWLTKPLRWGLDRGLTWLDTGYGRALRWCLGARGFIYLALLAAFAWLAWGASQLDTELVPELHQGEFTAEVALPVGTPLQATREVLDPVEKAMREQVPHLAGLTTVIGSERDSTEAGDRGEHTAKLRVQLSAGSADSRPWRPGTSRSAEIEAEARAAVRHIFDTVPDARVHITSPVLFSFKPPIEIEVRGLDLDDLGRATATVAQRLASVPGLRDVQSSIVPGHPEVQIDYDRDRLMRSKLELRAVAELVRDKILGKEATSLRRRDRKVPIRVRLAGAREATVAQLREIVINPGSDHPVPLAAVADIEVARGPNEIRRVGQRRVGLVTANLEDAGLGSASAEVMAAVRALDLPPGITTAMTGQSEEWDVSARSLWLALALAVFLVYVVMAAQFESLILPTVILLTIPLALVGVVLALWLLHIPVSIVVLLGCILLAGIVVNNAIVLVDYVGQLRHRGLSTHEALITAGRVRLRPILMTTLTTVLGLVPMALGLGDGAEIRMPMAITVIAGLSVSTLLTLVVIPTLYAALDAFGLAGIGSGAAPMLKQELAQIRPDQLSPETPNDGEEG